jgi:flagellar basal body rod protein FlgC
MANIAREPIQFDLKAVFCIEAPSIRRRETPAMSDAMAIAASAMRSAENRMTGTAARIVRLASTQPAAPIAPTLPAQPPARGTPSVVMPTADLVEEMTDLNQAELGLTAGIAAFRAADRMTRQTLDILA